MSYKKNSGLNSLGMDFKGWGESIEAAVTGFCQSTMNSASVDKTLELAHMAHVCCRDSSIALAAALRAYHLDSSQSDGLKLASQLIGFTESNQEHGRVRGLMSKRFSSHENLVSEGVCWLNQREAELAEEALEAAKQKNPRDLLTSIALEVAQGKWSNPAAQGDVFYEKGFQEEGEEQYVYFLASFWLYQMANVEFNKRQEAMQLAFEANPCLLTYQVVETSLCSDLFVNYISSLEQLAEKSPPELSYRLRWLALSKLLKSNIKTSLKFELSLRTLRNAFEEKVDFLPGYLMILEHLTVSAFYFKREADVLDVIDCGLLLPRSAFELGFMAMKGLMLSNNKTVYREMARICLPESIGESELNEELGTDIERVKSKEWPLFTNNEKQEKDENAASDFQHLEGIERFDAEVFSSSMLDLRDGGSSLFETPLLKAKMVLNTSDKDAVVHSLISETISAIDMKESSFMTDSDVRSSGVLKKLGASPNALGVEERVEVERHLEAPDYELDVISSKVLEKMQVPDGVLQDIQEETRRRVAERCELAKLGARRAARFPFSHDAVIRRGSKKWFGMIRDLSVTGLFLLGDFSVSSGEELLIEFLPGIGKKKRLIKLKAKVVRTPEHGLGWSVQEPS